MLCILGSFYLPEIFFHFSGLSAKEFLSDINIIYYGNKQLSHYDDIWKPDCGAGEITHQLKPHAIP